MRKPKSIRRVKYTVRGSGVFPFDMLRYEGAEPATSEDYSWIGPLPEHSADYLPHHISPTQFPPGDLRRDVREMMLCIWMPTWYGSHVVRDELVPCHARWRSFGWSVTEVYPIERIPYADVPKSVLVKLGYE